MMIFEIFIGFIIGFYLLFRFYDELLG